MLIEIFADFSCPWCFVGRRRLARAQAMRPQLPLRIVWQPFRLNPELPPDGVERQKRGKGLEFDLDRRAAAQRALASSANKEGIRLAFDRITRIPNTLAAHRLMRFAARWRREDALAERLFSAYFELGQDIAAASVLIACAAAAGLPAEPVAEFLAGDQEAATVASIDALARQGGVAGVPFFVFDRRFALAGAHEPATFLPLLDALSFSSDDVLSTTAPIEGAPVEG